MNEFEFQGQQEPTPAHTPAEPVYTPVFDQPAEPQPAEPVFTEPVYTQPQPAPVTYGFEMPEPPKPPKKEKKRGSGIWWKLPVNLILAAAVAVGSSFVTGWVMNKQSNNNWQQQFQLHQEVVDNKIASSGNSTTPSGQTNPEAPAAEGMNPAQVYARNVGAVVAIANEGVSTNI